jgi:hypothetical protein
MFLWTTLKLRATAGKSGFPVFLLPKCFGLFVLFFHLLACLLVQSIYLSPQPCDFLSLDFISSSVVYFGSKLRVLYEELELCDRPPNFSYEIA